MKSTPHDALFRAAFSDPVRVGGLLRRILPRRFAEQIDWDALECVHGVYVDRHLGLHASDLVFRAPLIGFAEESVYFPVEHQSRVQGYMPLRLNEYQVCLGKVLCRACEPGDLPVVLPVLVSHAPTGWKRPLCADDMYMCGLERLGIAEFVPRFTMLHLDLMLASDAELRALGTDPFAVVTLWALRESRNGRALVTQLPNFADVVRAMPGRPGGLDESQAWSRYIQLAASDLTAHDLLSAIRQFTPELEEITMTIAEQLRQEGRQEGRQENQVRTLTMLLSQRFGPIPAPYRERLTHESTDQLETMLRRVLTARSLDEVFAKARPR